MNIVYLIFYTEKYDTNTISIARILYGGSDISRQLDETSEW